MTTKLKEAEVRFARAFLHAIHGNESNGYLLLAIIAWMRSESGTKYIGNNPLNLRPGKDIAAFTSGKRRGPGGYFAVFKSLAAAAKATAARLLKAGNDYRGYALIVKAAQRASSGGGQVTQAIDFMSALALSKWSSTHYGTQIIVNAYKGPDGTTKTVYGFDLSKNSIVKVWAGLTGMKIPAEWFTDTVKPPNVTPPRPRPQQPRSLEHVQPKGEYIQPYAAQQFYAERPHLSDQSYASVDQVDL